MQRPDAKAAMHLARQFQVAGKILTCEPYGSGHINDTFAVRVQQEQRSCRYILQHINKFVFKKPAEVMANIRRVTDHLRGKLEAISGSNPEREALRLVRALDGEAAVVSGDGEHWRMYQFIEDARTYDVVLNNGQAFEAARAFARFQELLADLPGPPLHEAIPGFHNTPQRLRNLQAAIAADTENRAADCAADIDLAARLGHLAESVNGPLSRGELPLRVVHNDTKINNVMIDDSTGKGVCVIDLDTVGSGSVLDDFGDQVRTATGHFQENETDLTKVYIDLERFETLVHGYLEAARAFVTPAEIDLLTIAGARMTYENGIRFLTDFLQGDVYFRIHHPTENLDRARSQFAFVEDMLRQSEAMNEIVRRYANGQA